MRIAVYGGTFSPFGDHHRDVLRHVAGSGQFDEGVVLPSVAHPLKKGQFPYEHRLNMAEIAVMNDAWAIPVVVSEIERYMLRDGTPAPLFTIKVLRALRAYHEQAEGETPEIRFVIGPDIVAELDKWVGVEDIRSEFGFYEAPDVGMHSTQIRRLLSRGDKRWEEFVSPGVAEYIRIHRLYNVERTTCDHEFKEVPGFSAMWDVERCDACGLENSTYVEDHP